jgi:4-amino-4-deoxy-L-arabinose transferase-like glycosyltransferase
MTKSETDRYTIERTCVRPACLWVILLIAALFRLPFLAANPISVHADEASSGYDAYSIWETGKDQHGESFPLFARSFGEYNEALHRYILAPSVALFGLNAFAIRLPNALLGILTVWILFHLARSLTQNWTIACLASLFLALSPWHVQFSRWSARAILMPLFFCLALFLLLKTRDRSRYGPLSALSFGLCLYTYSAARVFVPLFVLGLVWIFRRALIRHKTLTLVSGVLFSGIFARLFVFWITPEGMNRAQELVNPDLLLLVTNYLRYFGPDYLFWTGDTNLRHSIPGMGQLYHFEAILVPIGLFHAWRSGGKTRAILFLWLFLYPIPAAFTGEPHAIRSLVGAPLFAILSAMGAYALYLWTRTRRGHRSLTRGFAIVAALNVCLYLKLFYVDYPKRIAWWWEYGLKEAILYAESRGDLTIQHTHGFYTPFYIHILFHTRFSPTAYQALPKSLRNTRWEGTTTPLMGRYLNLNVTKLSFDEGGKALLIMRPEDIAILDHVDFHWEKVHHLKDPSGQEVISLIEATYQ